MADPVNLRHFKKRRARTEADAVAAQNRVTYGMAKPVKIKLEAETAKAAAFLDGRKLDPKRPA